MVIYWVLLAVIACERSAELVVSARHASGLLRRGGVEYGLRHFPVMIALHVALIAGCVIEPLLGNRAFTPALGWPMLAITVLANAMRWWCIATLGGRWTARVIVLPGAPLVRSGPYRWFRHPNYAAVIVEGIALPLTGSAWITAVAFTTLNAALLTVRVRCETRALAAAAPTADLTATVVGGRAADPAASPTAPLDGGPDDRHAGGAERGRSAGAAGLVRTVAGRGGEPRRAGRSGPTGQAEADTAGTRTPGGEAAP